MKNKFSRSSSGPATSLKFRAARLHARITRRLTGISYNPATPSVDTAHNLFGSLWSPLRLELLKAPLTRLHE